MKNIIKYIPNTLTCMNLVFGCYACILGLCGNYEHAMIAIFISAGFDFVDGLAARLLNAHSPIGKDLDSLSDIVSFGVAPGMMLFNFIDTMQKTTFGDSNYGKLFLLVAFMIPVFSALRLAKFNIDERQKTSFIGLPVPANAIFWASLLYAIKPMLETNINIQPLFVLIIISALTVSFSLLLVSEIPMFSLKIKSLSWKENKIRYILILASIVLIACFGIIGITASILLYILLSIINRK